MIVCALHTHIALSHGDECADDAIFVPCDKVPALIEALEKVTKAAPTCRRTGCDAPATTCVKWNDGAVGSYYCNEHGVTVTPVTPVTEVTV